MAVQIIGHEWHPISVQKYFIHAIFSEVWELESFQTAKVTLKFAQAQSLKATGIGDIQLIGHVRFPISLALSYQALS